MTPVVLVERLSNDGAEVPTLRCGLRVDESAETGRYPNLQSHQPVNRKLTARPPERRPGVLTVHTAHLLSSSVTGLGCPIRLAIATTADEVTTTFTDQSANDNPEIHLQRRTPRMSSTRKITPAQPSPGTFRRGEMVCPDPDADSRSALRDQPRNRLPRWAFTALDNPGKWPRKVALSRALSVVRLRCSVTLNSPVLRLRQPLPESRELPIFGGRSRLSPTRPAHWQALMMHRLQLPPGVVTVPCQELSQGDLDIALRPASTAQPPRAHVPRLAPSLLENLSNQ